VSCVYHSEEAENQYLMGGNDGKPGLFGSGPPPPGKAPDAAGGKPGGP
jgi:hypothetical protein